MKKSTYWEKLNDPRWQRKRLEIMERDVFTCLGCFDSETRLNVHHRYYIKDREPWDYPGFAYVTLCDECHKSEHEVTISNLARWETVADAILHQDINFEPIACDLIKILGALELGGVSRKEITLCVLGSLIDLYRSRELKPLSQKEFWYNVEAEGTVSE